MQPCCNDINLIPAQDGFICMSCGNFLDSEQQRAYYATSNGGPTRLVVTQIAGSKSQTNSRLPTSPLDTERDNQKRRPTKGRRPQTKE